MTLIGFHGIPHNIIAFYIDLYLKLLYVVFLVGLFSTMWRYWWWIFFTVIWTPVNSHYFRGSLGKYKPQKILMLHDHSVCLSNIQHMSLRQTLTYGFLCVKFKVLHCLSKKHMVYSSLTDYDFLRLRISPYCGSIWLLENPQTSYKENVFIGVTKTLNIHLNILRFQFFLSNRISCHQHGMSLSYAKVKSETYCGTRIPWNIIIKGNQVLIHLSMEEFKPYSLRLYYSSFLPMWIANLSRILTKLCNASSTFDAIQSFNFLNIFVKSYIYYVMSSPENYIELHVSLNIFFKTDMIIYDGPGRLSRNIFEMNEAQMNVSRYIQTTAFVAFISMKLLDSNLNYSTSINITTTSGKHIASDCVNFKRGLIQAKSSKSENVACMGIFTLQLYEIRIKVSAFTFIGPIMLTDLSESVCQYGGLVVQFNGRNQQHEFCESLHHYTLISNNKSLTFIVVWFSGFSHGELTASLSAGDCKTSHPQFYLPKSALSSSSILLRPIIDSSQTCEIFICPAPQNHRQNRFTVQLGPHSLGTTRLSFIHLYTLHACDPKFKYIHRSDISIKYIALNNWPLNLTPSIRHAYHNITDNIVLKFDYLHMANISVGYMCKPEMTRMQMAIVFKQSSCDQDQRGHIRKFVVNNIPSLHGACQSTNILFTPPSMGGEGYLNFIYKDTGQINHGMDFLVSYSKCPMNCRNYRYSIFVRMVNIESVRRYTTNVGQYIYTGKYHRGFRLTILPPNPLCDQHLQCQLQLTLSRGRFTNTALDGRHQESTLQFYEKR